MVQAIHQEDLKHVSRWLESTRWRKRLPFMRDRVMENYLWSLGEAYEQGSKSRLNSNIIGEWKQVSIS
ncbi:hypothetical protein CsSME_00039575 [Camellia sinensis var. sinensis]